MKRNLLVLAAALLFAATASAAALHVDIANPHAADDNAGTAEKPLKSISAAYAIPEISPSTTTCSTPTPPRKTS